MNAPISMLDVIRTAATTPAKDKTCPFCGEMPPLASMVCGKYVVACDNDDCHVAPQAVGRTVAEAWAKWNWRLG